MINLEKHIAYSKSPELFMKECWLSFNAFTHQFEHIKPFDYQIDFINNIHNNNFNAIVKSRQIHLTSMMEIYIAWYILFNYNKVVAIMSHNLDSGKRILDNIKIILQNYSADEIKDEKVVKTYFHWEDDFVKNNKTELELTNGCRVKVLTPSSNAGRGETLNMLFIDEAANIKELEYIWMGLGMSLSYLKDSKAIIASTPKDNSYFNKLFLNTYNNENHFNYIRLHWTIHPLYKKGIEKIDNTYYQYSSPWFEEMCKHLNYNQKIIQQEIECVINYADQNEKQKTLSFRMSTELYKKLEIKLNDKSISEYIRNLIEKDLNK